MPHIRQDLVSAKSTNARILKESVDMQAGTTTLKGLNSTGSIPY